MIEGAQQEQATPSLRDTISAEVEKVEAEQPRRDVSDRARDESGRFASKEPEVRAEKPTKEPIKEPKTEAKAAPEIEAPAYVAPKRPASWKAELDPHWAKLPKEIHDEIARREADFARGVSTYKTEYDRLKPLGEALKPYESVLQQTGLTATQLIQAAMSAHNAFSGTKEQKLRELARYVNEYQIPVHEMLIQGEDGKIYFNQQYFQTQQPKQPQGLTPDEVDKRVRDNWIQMERNRQLNEFVNAKDGAGNPRYPHFEAVKPTMDGILRAGLAQDLPSAYDAALRMPEHSAIYDEMNKQRLATEEAAKARAQAELAAKAKANRVSPRPQTPTGTAGSGGAKTLRDTISDVVEDHG